jgi:signal peptidase II
MSEDDSRAGKFVWIQLAAVFLLVLGLDQLTKQIIVSSLSRGDRIEVIPGFFNIVLTYNPGAAFGLFAGYPDGLRTIVLGIATTFAVGLVLYFLFFEYNRDPFGQAALIMILAGAAGNIIDRIRYGEVVDFLDFYLGAYHWPAFNVADSAICIGVAFIIFRRPRK